MFAVVRTGGKQYRVAPGDKIVVEKMDGAAGDRIDLGDVLFGSDGSTPAVAAEIIAQAKADKVIVFKKRRRHNYRRKNGHRQQHTILRILQVGSATYDKAAAQRSAAPQQPEPQAQAQTVAAESAAPAAAEAAPAKAGRQKKPARETATPVQSTGAAGTTTAAEPGGDAGTAAADLPPAEPQDGSLKVHGDEMNVSGDGGEADKPAAVQDKEA